MVTASQHLRADPYVEEETKFRRDFVFWVLVLAALLAGALLTFPEVDLAIAAAFRDICAGTVETRGWCGGAMTEIARHALMAIFVFAAVAAVAATVRTCYLRGRLFGLEQARCWFLLLAFIAGPGLVANLTFKDNWGRARPREIVEFGGAKQFTPPLLPANECARNCAFVSGEAASVFVTFFALALLIPQYRVALIAGGIAAGAVSGLIRMSQGAHFLSDIIFAGIFMALTVSVVHILTIGMWKETGRGGLGASIPDILGRMRRFVWSIPGFLGSSPRLP